MIGDGGYFLIYECEISHYTNMYSGSSQKGWWLFWSWDDSIW